MQKKIEQALLMTYQINLLEAQQQRLTRQQALLKQQKSDTVMEHRALAFQLMNSMSHHRFCRLFNIRKGTLL